MAKELYHAIKPLHVSTATNHYIINVNEQHCAKCGHFEVTLVTQINVKSPNMRYSLYDATK